MNRSIILGFLILLMSCPALWAEDPTQDKPDSAPVMVDGVKLWRVRGAGGYPASRRAREITSKLIAAAHNPAITTNDIELIEQNGHPTVMIGNERLAHIFNADAEMDNITPTLMAKVCLLRARKALEMYRENRSRSAIITGSLKAVWALFFWGLMLLLTRFVYWRLRHILEKRYRNRIENLKIQTFKIGQLGGLWSWLLTLLNLLRFIAIVSIILICSHRVFSQFVWTRPLAHRIFGLVLDPIKTMALAFWNWLPSLAFLIVLYVVVRYLLKLIRLYFNGIESGRVHVAGFDSDWVQPTYRIVRLFILIFAVVIAYPYIPGSSSEAFKGISLLAGVMLSIGSSTAISNIIAGYAIVYRRAFKVGDRIKIDTHVGDVEQIRLMVTHLRSLKHEEIIIPNSTILNSTVINYSSMMREQNAEGVILHTVVGIGYDTPWRQVEAMLVEAARRTEAILKNPPPFVLQKEMGDYAVNYELNAYSNMPAESPRIYSELHSHIQDVFNEYGVQIMSPRYVADPEEPKVVPRDKWYKAPAVPDDET